MIWEVLCMFAIGSWKVGGGVLFVFININADKMNPTAGFCSKQPVNFLKEKRGEAFSSAVRHDDNIGQSIYGFGNQISTQMIQHRVVHIEDERMIKMILKPCLQPFQITEVYNEAIRIALLAGESKLKGPIVAMNEGAMPAMGVLPMREGQV